jgi:hypothetical protein
MISRQVKHDWEAGKKEGERDRERYLGREGEQHSGERKQHGLILTVGLNQQRLRISRRCQSIITTED